MVLLGHRYYDSGATPLIEETYNTSTSVTSIALAHGYADGWRQTYDATGGVYSTYAYDPQGSLGPLDHSSNSSLPYFEEFVYDGYGNAVVAVRLSTGGAASYYPPAGFGGQQGYYSDYGPILVLLGHRYYDPATGRFINRDPIGTGGGPNVYGFCGNNPITNADPSGFDPFLVHVTDDKGHFTGKTYIMDVPHVYNTISSNMRQITNNFGKRIDKVSGLSKYKTMGQIFLDENWNGKKYDFKVTSPAPLPSGDPKSLYHLRALGGNFLWGMEGARSGLSLSTVLDVGNGGRPIGIARHNPGKLLGDTVRSIFGDTKPLGEDMTHPQDEQQAIQDGYNWWLRNKKP